MILYLLGEMSYLLSPFEKKLKKENSTPNILLQGGQIGVDYKINFYNMNTKLESLSSANFKKKSTFLISEK